MGFLAPAAVCATGASAASFSSPPSATVTPVNATPPLIPSVATPAGAVTTTTTTTIPAATPTFPAATALPATAMPATTALPAVAGALPTQTTTTQTALPAAAGAGTSSASPSALPSVAGMPTGPGLAAGALPAAAAADRSPGMSLPVDQAGTAAAGAAGPAKTPAASEDDIRNQAFGAALTGLLPLKPPEIRKVIEHYDETRQAVTTPIYPDPKPTIVSQTISLEPGTVPTEIKLAVGQVSTITMLDSSGQPWPIQDLTWAGNFEVVAATNGNGGGGGGGGGGSGGKGSDDGSNLVNPLSPNNMIRITPLADFAQGNISIRMIGLKSPVVFVLRVHRDEVYYRFDARLPDYGPFAKQSLIGSGGGGGLEAGDAVANSVLDGIPPAGAERMTVIGTDSRTSAYKIGSKIYVRTPLELLSPGWTSSTSSADGTNVYAIDDAPVLLLSDHGRVLQAHLIAHGSALSSSDGNSAQ